MGFLYASRGVGLKHVVDLRQSDINLEIAGLLQFGSLLTFSWVRSLFKYLISTFRTFSGSRYTY